MGQITEVYDSWSFRVAENQIFKQRKEQPENGEKQTSDIHHRYVIPLALRCSHCQHSQHVCLSSTHRMPNNRIVRWKSCTQQRTATELWHECHSHSAMLTEIYWRSIRSPTAEQPNPRPVNRSSMWTKIYDCYYRPNWCDTRTSHCFGIEMWWRMNSRSENEIKNVEIVADDHRKCNFLPTVRTERQCCSIQWNKFRFSLGWLY